jgi:DNA invertase Pin-like site-specific DNA recombinase
MIDRDKIQNILTLYKQGLSERKIAKKTRLDRKTVNKIINGNYNNKIMIRYAADDKHEPFEFDIETFMRYLEVKH